MSSFSPFYSICDIASVTTPKWVLISSLLSYFLLSFPSILPISLYLLSLASSFHLPSLYFLNILAFFYPAPEMRNPWFPAFAFFLLSSFFPLSHIMQCQLLENIIHCVSTIIYNLFKHFLHILNIPGVGENYSWEADCRLLCNKRREEHCLYRWIFVVRWVFMIFLQCIFSYALKLFLKKTYILCLRFFFPL